MTREQAVRALRAKMNGQEYRPVGSLASFVTPERVTWVWSGRLALGKISMLDGNPGLGKSTMLLDIAARISTGDPFPGQEGRRPPAGVVVLSAEDGVADTIVPRLIAAEANLERVYILRGAAGLDGVEVGLSIPGYLGVVALAMDEVGAHLLIVDPLMAYFGAEVNANKDQDVRRALAPLAALLEHQCCAAWLVRHLTKGESRDALYRGGGSIGIIGAARFGSMVAKDPDDDEARVVAPTKVNLGPEPPALRYRLEGVPNTDVARVLWDGEPARWTAMDLLETGVSEEDKIERSESEEWLLELLTAGAITYTEVMSLGRKAGFTDKILKRAKVKIGAKSRREGGLGSDGQWVWYLPLTYSAPTLSPLDHISNYGNTLSTKNHSTVSSDDSRLRDLRNPNNSKDPISGEHYPIRTQEVPWDDR